MGDNEKQQNIVRLTYRTSMTRKQRTDRNFTVYSGASISVRNFNGNTKIVTRNYRKFGN